MKKMKFYIKQIMMFAIVGATAFSIACDALSGGDDDPKLEDPIASFQLQVDATNFLQVTFTNFSQNATSYTWDFGDGNSSTDESPVHTYAEGGSYTVVLTATNDAGSATKSEKVDLNDPLSTQRTLIGDNGKVWQFVADASTGSFAYQVGPADYSAVWWSLGGAEQLCVRECIMDDTWTFNTDGTFTFENNGDAWAEGAFKEDLLGGCFDASVAANWIGANGEDLNGWNSGTHDFTFDPIAGSLVITGGFIGIPKAANNAEVSVPQPSVSYTVVKLVNAEVDTLVVETPIDGGYWRSTLVSYDNASDKVVVGECAPVEEVNVTFKVNMNDYTGAFTTVYVTGSFNGWSGDANPMSDANADGIWEVTLPLPANTDNIEYKFAMDNWTAFEQWDNADLDCIISSDGTNNNRGLSTGSTDMTVSFCFGACTECAGDAFGGAADLVGNWKLAPVAGATGVGPTQGDTGWWANDEASVTGARACMFDDVWTFDAAGNFSYQMDGSTFLEAWQGAAPDGCGTPVAPFDGTGTYTFTADATSITLNGEGAFIGLPKVNNAGEISNGAAVQSSITYMVTEYTAGAALTLDIEAGSGVWWRFKLVKN